MLPVKAVLKFLKYLSPATYIAVGIGVKPTYRYIDVLRMGWCVIWYLLHIYLVRLSPTFVGYFVRRGTLVLRDNRYIKCRLHTRNMLPRS